MQHLEDSVALILAAGKGTRMKSAVPKVLHPVAGAPMLGRVLDSARTAGVRQFLVVVGHQAAVVQDRFAGEPGVRFVVQADQLGTGHAVKIARPHLDADQPWVLLLYGDVPLLTPETLSGLAAAHARGGAAASVLTTCPDDPSGYGRIIRDASGSLLSIVEDADLAPDQRAIREINTGLYVFSTRSLFSALDAITPVNAQGEYYLTSVFAVMVARGERVQPVKGSPALEFLGINNRVELAMAESEIYRRKAHQLMLEGVTIHDPSAVYVHDCVTIGEDTELYPGVSLRGRTRIGRGCVIGAHTTLTDTVVEDGAVLKECCTLDGSTVGPGATVGPFSNLRPGTALGRGVKVGNFVEIKASSLGDGTKASHLSYLGDAQLGRNVNIGAGTITCNYDGRHKHRTVIGDGVFVGSDSVLVAPVEIGEGAYVAAASAVTRDVPPGALAIARQRQVNKEGYREILNQRLRTGEEHGHGACSADPAAPGETGDHRHPESH